MAKRSSKLKDPPSPAVGLINKPGLASCNAGSAKGVTAISPNLYRKLADTLNIRMVEGVYKPGDSSIMHAHPDFAMYVLEGSMVELKAADGSRQNVEFKTGMAVVMPAATHSAKNIGKQTLKLIAVEVDRPRK